MATCFEMRNDPRFLRNEFKGAGKHEFPIIKRQTLPQGEIDLIACSETKPSDTNVNTCKGVHFFVEDYKFAGIFTCPQQTWTKYSQYAFLLTPDFSLYPEMQRWRQEISVAMNRWCGAWWQSKGALVIPTVSWSTAQSFDYCFDGIEQNATVAVSTLGCKANRTNFLRGYDAMLERLAPSIIICYSKPFKEMKGNVVFVPYNRFDWEG